MRKRPLLLCACVFLSGLVCQRYDNLLFIIVLLGTMVTEIIIGINHKRIKSTAGRSIVLLSAFLLGMIHMQGEENFRNAYMSQVEDGNKVTIWGEIKKIESTDYGIRMLLTDSYIHLEKEDVPCNDVMVYASSKHFRVGEIHKIIGKLHTFEQARNQGNFDAHVFYQSQKIDFSIWMEDSEYLGEKTNWIQEYMLIMKDRWKAVYEDCMERSAAGFFIAMVVGDREMLDDMTKELFALGGLSHILAISGLHVSMIGRGLYHRLRKCQLGFFPAGLLAGSVLAGYCIMVGDSMSTLRAVGMMYIFFLGQCMGKSYDMLNALGAMCLFLLFQNPFLIEYSGFWFSFTALLGVGFVGNTFSEVYEEMKKGKRIWKGLGMSVGITLTTLPVVAACYYEIPLYSSLVNFVALPILTPVFVLAVCGGLVGLFFPAIAKLLLFPCGLGYEFYIWLCKGVAELPFASIICGEPKPWVFVIYYLILSVGVVLLRRKRISLHQKICCSIGLSMICLVLIIYPKSKPCEITFLDVGQGDAIYISTGDDITYFIDGGSTSEESVGDYRILPFLKAKGVASIDYWFVSHADTDHVSGVLEVMESGYEVEHFVISEHAPMDENMDLLLATAEACGSEVIYMEAGDCVQTEHTRLKCLYPWSKENMDRNDASMVLELEIEVKDNVYRAFFAGDISSEVEEMLMGKGCVDDVWLYKASHHGSKYSNSKEFLEVLQPEITVISCGESNIYGHPHAEVLDRIENTGSDIRQTQNSGQITIQVVGGIPEVFFEMIKNEGKSD